MAATAYATAIIVANVNVAMISIQGAELESFIQECIRTYTVKSLRLLRPASEDEASRNRVAHLIDLYTTTALASIRMISHAQAALKDGLGWDEVKQMLPGNPAGQLDEVFEAGALTSLVDAFKGDHRALLNWWRRLMTADVRGRFQFPLDVATAYGSCALMDPPQVIVGTIHSVKGGQADVVYLFPDLSQSGDAQYQRTGEARDSVIRVFYVGATRARETLYICQRESLVAFSI